jgi:predicted nucleic-acid-binding Zn-ribbon protein
VGLFSDKPDKVTLPTGKVLSCLVCGHDEFHERDAQLNTPGMTFFKLDWLNTTGQCLLCDRCGYIHWFLGRT